MYTISKSLETLFSLARFEARVTRKLDARLGGISFTEFQILYCLSQVEGEKMRRVDLAEKIGLTQSGITRLLLPMQKIGLVKREADKHDARVSFVAITKGGRQQLEEAIDRAELFVSDVLPSDRINKVQELARFLGDVR